MQLINRIRAALGLPPAAPPDPVERNLAGQAAEQAGDIDQAIRLYELNVRARHDAPFPYERLRIIYTRQKRYGEALRVIRAYLAILGTPDRATPEGKLADIQHWLNSEQQTLKRIKPPQ